jgi:peptidoglycan-N-acetylglucosamine deacetylase
MFGQFRRDITSTFSLGGWRPILHRVASTASGGTRALALSIDDGPTPETTPRVLDLLRQYNATASFFLLGERAAANPELVDAIAADGHALYAHGYSHVRLDGLSEAAAISEMARAESLLVRARPTPVPYLMRLPYGAGHRNARIHRLMNRWQPGCQFGHWSYDFKDFLLANSCDSLEELVRRCDQAVARAFDNPRFVGGVALMHENPLGAEGTLVPEIGPTLLSSLLKATSERNIKVVAMTSPTRWPWWSPYIRTVAVE